MERPTLRPNDLSRSLLPLAQDRTLISVIILRQSSWLVAAVVPGVERQPLKKLPRTSKRCFECCSGGRTRQRKRGDGDAHCRRL